MNGGLKWERFKRKDYNFHKIFGATPTSEVIIPLKRDISGIPLVYQGVQNSCVSCSVTWIKQYLDQTKPSLSWPFLAKISDTDQDGATPSQVLEPARKVGILTQDEWQKVPADSSVNLLSDELKNEAGRYKIGAYSFLTTINAQTLYQALKVSPLAIGVDNWQGAGPHMMAAFDVTDDGKALKCANWWNATNQDIQIVPFDAVTLAVSFHEKPEQDNIRMSLLNVFIDMLNFIPWKKIVALVGALILLVIGFGQDNLASIEQRLEQMKEQLSGLTQPTNTEEQKLGASGVAAFYSTTIGGAGVNSTATTIPVTSLTLFTGESLTSSTLIFPTYLVIDPNSRSSREIVECWGLNSSSVPYSWTGCNRGMSALGSNTTSTVAGAAFAHAPGTAMIMSDVPAYYNRYLDTSTAQTATGTKTFTSDSFYLGNNTTTTKKRYFFNTGQANEPYVYFSGTSTMGFAPDGISEFAFNSGGTTVGVSPTGGLSLIAGLLLINASTTAGLAIDSLNNLYVNASSTSSTNGGFMKFNSSGQLYWDYPTFLANSSTFTGSLTLAGNTTSSGSFSVGTPTYNNNATPKVYVDPLVTLSEATGTAGTNLAAGDAVYISATSSKIIQTSSSDTSSTVQFVGFVTVAATTGNEVRFTRPGGTNCQFTGLTTSTRYYLNGTNGQISTTPGTVQAFVGMALNANCLQVRPPSFIKKGVILVSNTTSTFVYTGFYPAYISIAATVNQNGKGISIGDDTNNCAIFGDGIGAQGSGSSALAWSLFTIGGAAYSNGTVASKSSLGFTVTGAVQTGGTTSLVYSAHSE